MRRQVESEDGTQGSTCMIEEEAVGYSQWIGRSIVFQQNYFDIFLPIYLRKRRPLWHEHVIGWMWPHRMNKSGVSISYEDSSDGWSPGYAWLVFAGIRTSVEQYGIPTTSIYLNQLRDSSEDPTWRELFSRRALQDKHIRSLLTEIISNRTNRESTDDNLHPLSMDQSILAGIYNAEQISSTYGLLAFDVLQETFPPSFNHAPTVSTDVRHLTREYYSLEMARLISRDIGLNLLREMKERREIRTDERALLNALYIMQCFHPRGIFLSLNRLRSLEQRLVATPLYSTMAVSDQCRLILATMQTEKFLPTTGGGEYYDIDNSFFHATFDGKPTIPLTLVSIFCALAEDCGLTARPIGFLGEVMAQVDQPASTNSVPLIVSVFDGETSACSCNESQCCSLGKIITLDEISARLSDVLDTPLSHPLSFTPII